MARITVNDGTLHVALSSAEQALARHRGAITLPQTSVRSVRVVRDGMAVVRGLSTPAPGIPGIRKVGSLGAAGQRRFVAVRRGQPAVLVRLLPGSEWDSLVIGADHAEQTVRQIAAGLPATRYDEAVVVDPETDSLHGSLRLPGPTPAPAALLLAGSGPIDRDGNAPGSPLDLQLALAESLAEAGVTSLRVDRRGIDDGTDWREVSLTQNTQDATAALRFLQAHPAVDSDRIVVIGHSEGSMHALRLATGELPPAAAVLLSAPARLGGDVLLWQAEQIKPGLPKPAKLIIGLTRIDITAKTRAAHEKLRATTTDTARVNGSTVNAAWFREFLDYDPNRDLRALRVPTLALTGTADLQTPPSDVDTIAGLAVGPVTTTQPEGISHLLRHDPAPVPTLGDYRRQLREPVDAAVLSTVTDWVMDHSGG